MTKLPDNKAGRKLSSSGSNKVQQIDSNRPSRRLLDAIASQPAVDNRRVKDLRRAIANGSFEIDPDRVAEKLFAFERSLLH
jgi:negative regulator of flagellin synthesis FlgM